VCVAWISGGSGEEGKEGRREGRAIGMVDDDAVVGVARPVDDSFLRVDFPK